MTNCNNNTLFIWRPSQDQAQAAMNNSCQSSCLGLTDPVGCGTRISARRSREKVREQIKDAVLNRLGAPVVKIEMDEHKTQ